MKFIFFTGALSAAFVSASILNWQFFGATPDSSSAAENHANVIRALKNDQSTSPADWFPGWKTLMLFLESMNPTFDHYSDWLPVNRDKLIHGYAFTANSYMYYSFLPDKEPLHLPAGFLFKTLRIIPAYLRLAPSGVWCVHR
jgi:hypothetical protein